MSDLNAVFLNRIDGIYISVMLWYLVANLGHSVSQFSHFLTNLVGLVILTPLLDEIGLPLSHIYDNICSTAKALNLTFVLRDIIPVL